MVYTLLLCLLFGFGMFITPLTDAITNRKEEDMFTSYLHWPRLHFSGMFQADTCTVNNKVINYNITDEFMDTSDGNDYRIGWNPNGTGAFRFVRTLVTSICYPDGHCGTSKELDPIIGSSLEDTGHKTTGKLVDLDPEDMSVSTVYGLRLRIGSYFSADLRPSPLTYMWTKAVSGFFSDSAQGGTFHTFLENIKWLKQASRSSFIRHLRKAVSSSKSRRLSLRFNVDKYNMDVDDDNFTLGRVVGAIGVSGSRAPLTTVHGRELETRAKERAQSAPFVLDLHNNRVHVDFGNSLPITSNGSHFVTSIGNLAVGYSRDNGPLPHTCSNQDFEWLGIVHYKRDDWYQTTAGIQTFPEFYPLTHEQITKLAKTPLVVAEVEGVWPDISCKEILLEEAAHGTLVRPHGERVFRRDAGEPFSFDLFVTKFGKPLPGAPVQLQMDRSPDSVEEPPLTLPSAPSVTNVNGTVSFIIHTSDPKNPRTVIDGQVYRITYKAYDQSYEENFGIRILIWDRYQTNATPTWVDHVYPIFKLYANLAPIMTKEFTDIGNFDEVKKDRKLIQMSMALPFDHPNYMPTSRDLSNAKRKMILEWLSKPELLYGTEGNQDGHVVQGTQAQEIKPVFENGSPSPDSLTDDHRIFSKSAQETHHEHTNKVTTQLLLRLENSASNNEALDITSKNNKLSADDELTQPSDGSKDQVHNSKRRVKGHLEKVENLMKPLSPVKRLPSQQSSQIKGYNRGKVASSGNILEHSLESQFSLEQLRQDLQTALEVEHATIPPYLTALSSIKNGHNNKVSHLLKIILVQEMLHMSLVANILNAVGGNPSMTHADFVPRYPCLLPGGVQRALVVPLQNLSHSLIKEVFMKIEEPTLTIKALEHRKLVVTHMEDHWKQRSDPLTGNKFYGDGTIKNKRNSAEHANYTHLKDIKLDYEMSQGHEDERDQEEKDREGEVQKIEKKENEEEASLPCIPQADTLGSLYSRGMHPQNVFETHKDSIGAFYSHILKTLGHLTKCGKDNSIFTGHPSRQVTSEMWYARKMFGHGKMIKVDDYFSAVRAIMEIMEQGEGSSPCMPVAADVDVNDMSHYFTFYSIYNGYELQYQTRNEREYPADVSEDVRQWYEICQSIYTFDGEKIDFDPAGVWPIVHNPRMSDYIPWSKPFLLARTFNVAYTKLLNSLELAYTGQPEIMKDAMGLMFSVSLNAKRLVRTPIKPGDNPDVGPNAAPIYEPII